MTALASYARQTNDTTLIDYAVSIRNRARRRQGEILAGIDKKPGPGRPAKKQSSQGRNVSEKPGRTQVARDAGISKKEQEIAMRVASMPEKEFERRVADPSLGQQSRKDREKMAKRTIKCPHCGGVIIV